MFANSYNRLSPITRSVVNAFVGFFVYGCWAIGVNLMHGRESAIKAGLVQGVYSFLLTFVMTLLIESVFSVVHQKSGRRFLAAMLTITVTCLIVFSGSWFVNYLAGTPEIFNTVILGYILGGAYSVGYTLLLAKEAAKVY